MNRLLRSSRAVVVFAILILPWCGCQATLPAREPPNRSPSLDYRAASVTTSDGQIVGANNRSPEDQLAQGARIGNSNGLAPGWRLTDDGLVYDASHRVTESTFARHGKQASR